ncbi:hypothetical protein CC014_18040 [Salmonella enterica]|nr:hypothetical protein [Salmonella enterica]EFO5648776.1 hypothetical protein [Salmonella enterica subsp. enterica serovar Miami]EAT1014641.1 hypothetical protein [Salmonella enterica]EBB2054777.1 hypothetical protein [Salmonella enterica]EBN0646513.1 hypothetical protein [Salmonella enterica]
MSETNITESVPAGEKRRLWSWWSAAGVCLCLMMAAAGFVLYVLVSGVTDLDIRLSRLEAQDNTATTTETLSTLQARISTLQAGLADNQQRVATLQKETEARTGPSQELASLQASAARLQQVQQEMAARLNALAEQLNALKAVPAAATPAPEKTPAEVKKQLSVKSRSTAVVAHHAPFVLTGVERRGAESWAAVAPRGYHSLSQIALIGEGESVTGWTLVRVGYSEATFRVNGRLTALKVE